jgi:hypothetical protein
MAVIPEFPASDPTLDAIKKAIEFQATLQKPRKYVGMSSIGESCARKLWYRFRWADKETFNADALLRFEDGHSQESVMIKRLRMVDGIKLICIDPSNGQQIGYQDLQGHFKGHCDGEILGLLQAPKTWHIWEHKSVNEKSFAKLQKLIEDFGEKRALQEWNPVYYAQGVLYMHYSGLDRHYMTVSTPGGREFMSVRTNADPAFAKSLIEKADRVINSTAPLAKISEKPEYYECGWCPFLDICHKGKFANRNCRTCIHSTPTAGGEWHCARFNKILSEDEQRAGCPAHLYLPGFVPGEQVDAGENWVDYKMPNGQIFRDSEGQHGSK